MAVVYLIQHLTHYTDRNNGDKVAWDPERKFLVHFTWTPLFLKQTIYNVIIIYNAIRNGFNTKISGLLSNQPAIPNFLSYRCCRQL